MISSRLNEEVGRRHGIFQEIVGFRSEVLGEGWSLIPTLVIVQGEAFVVDSRTSCVPTLGPRIIFTVRLIKSREIPTNILCNNSNYRKIYGSSHPFSNFHCCTIM